MRDGAQAGKRRNAQTGEREVSASKRTNSASPSSPARAISAQQAAARR